MNRQGLLFGVVAYGIWGLFPLYWPLLEPAGAIEILALRILLAGVTVAIGLAFARRLPGVARLGAVANRRLVLAGVLISINWGTYIYGVNSGHVVETSLGYFINPLVTIALGVVVLRERLRRIQWLAIAIGAVAVVIIGIDYGRLPWIALVLAATFGCYGLVKKQVGVAAPEGLLVESLAMALPAAVTLGVLAGRGDATFTHSSAGHGALLASAGVITVVPLLFFAGAASRLPLSTVGLLQYLAPVLQLAVGVGIRHEALPPAELAGFCLVWLALIILTADGLRQRGSRTTRAAGTRSSRSAVSRSRPCPAGDLALGVKPRERDRPGQRHQHREHRMPALPDP